MRKRAAALPCTSGQPLCSKHPEAVNRSIFTTPLRSWQPLMHERTSTHSYLYPTRCTMCRPKLLSAVAKRASPLKDPCKTRQAPTMWASRHEDETSAMQTGNCRQMQEHVVLHEQSCKSNRHVLRTHRPRTYLHRDLHLVVMHNRPPCYFDRTPCANPTQTVNTTVPMTIC